MGGIAAYHCYDLRDTMATPVAVTIGVVVGVLLGLLTYGVLALLRDASQLARLIATLGLFGAGQAFMVLRWGPAIVQPRPMLPSRNVTLFGDVMIGMDRLLLIGIALACAVVLRFVYSGTLFGLATSAVAENRRVAASAGWSPNQIELVNFAVAGGLSALAAILLAPIVTLNAAVLSIAVIPALHRHFGIRRVRRCCPTVTLQSATGPDSWFHAIFALSRAARATASAAVPQQEPGLRILHSGAPNS
jgi:branched-subunit amino acid ABC-type transport system permease component